MCDETCGSGSNHAKECEIIARCKTSERPSTLRIDHEKFEKPTNAYATITPLRLLLLEEKNGDEWRRSNQLMDHHNGKQRNDKKVEFESELIFIYIYEIEFRIKKSGYGTKNIWSITSHPTSD